MAIARVLKDFRERKGLSVEALAKASGIKAKRLEQFESRERDPFFDELFLLAKGLRVQAATLLRRIQLLSSKGLQRQITARRREACL